MTHGVAIFSAPSCPLPVIGEDRHAVAASVKEHTWITFRNSCRLKLQHLAGGGLAYLTTKSILGKGNLPFAVFFVQGRSHRHATADGPNEL